MNQETSDAILATTPGGAGPTSGRPEPQSTTPPTATVPRAVLVDRQFVDTALERSRAARLAPFATRPGRGDATVSWVGDLQQGDGGKGAMTDRLAAYHDVVVRTQGGDNAGHTTAFTAADGSTRTLKHHLLPSGLRHPGISGILGNGVMVNLETLSTEIHELRASGIDVHDRLFVSGRAHIVLPLHVHVDRREESRRGHRAIGTTGRGIGPANVSKVNRIGLRASEVFTPDVVQDRVEANVRFFGLDEHHVEENVAWVARFAPVLAERLIDAARVVNGLVDTGRSVLFEGAQGPLIDLEHGIYPYVTTTPTTVHSVASGGGFDVSRVQHRIGVLKAYQTMVGNGAFVTEDVGALAGRLREAGDEYGTTTGRDRRCGWLDLVQARWAAEINRFTTVVLTKLDVLDSFERIGVCLAYDHDGRAVVEFEPENTFLDKCAPVLTYVEGWNRPTAGIRRWEDLPGQARELCRLIESHLGTEIGAVTVGPRDTDMIPVPGSSLGGWLASR